LSCRFHQAAFDRSLTTCWPSTASAASSFVVAADGTTISNTLCAIGEISLTMTQLRAIEILLRKSIPDLAAAEIRSEQTYRYVVEVPPVLGRDEWQQKYGQNSMLD
jgi:hypothetical protein